MREESSLIHCEHVSARSFDEVVAAFRAAVGDAQSGALRKAVEASTGTDDFETRLRALEGSSGFLLLFEVDHGAWMSRFGLEGRAKHFLIGNPRFGRSIIAHDIGVAMNVPLRVLIYEDPSSGTCRLAYDLPSSLMKRLKNDRVMEAAKILDDRLSALAEMATGAKA